MQQLLVQHKHSWKGTRSAEVKKHYVLLFVRCPSSLFTLKRQVVHPFGIGGHLQIKEERRAHRNAHETPVCFNKPIIFRNYIKLLARGKQIKRHIKGDARNAWQIREVEPAAWLLAVTQPGVHLTRQPLWSLPLPSKFTLGQQGSWNWALRSYSLICVCDRPGCEQLQNCYIHAGMDKWIVNLCMNKRDTLLRTENSNMKKLWFSITASYCQICRTAEWR